MAHDLDHLADILVPCRALDDLQIAAPLDLGQPVAQIDIFERTGSVVAGFSKSGIGGRIGHFTLFLPRF